MAANSTPTRRDQIQAVAEQLFRDKGYLATSMRDIADQLHLKGGGSLYAHIRGKEELLWRIANDAADVFFAALERALRQEAPPAEKLRAALLGHLLVITEHLSAAAVYFDEWRHLGEPRRSKFLERRDAYERRFQELIREGMAAGVFRPVDERIATLYVLSAMNAIRHWFKPGGRLSAQEVANLITDMLLNGLYQCEPPAAI